jgi:hypothetical protein
MLQIELNSQLTQQEQSALKSLIILHHKLENDVAIQLKRYDSRTAQRDKSHERCPATSNQICAIRLFVTLVFQNCPTLSLSKGKEKYAYG